MKSIIKYLAAAAFVSLAVSACETYKVDEPEMTKVAWIDGQYVVAAVNPLDASDTLSVFSIEITNTTNDDPDRVWVTITDYSLANSASRVSELYAPYVSSVNAYFGLYGYVYFPRAYRFAASCNKADRTFTCTDAEGEEPAVCYNFTMGGPSDSAAGFFDMDYDTYKVTVTDGKIGNNDVATATGYKANSLNCSIKIVRDSDNETQEYVLKGLKNTGWAGDTQDLADWLMAQ